jgi:hypothetical protein
MRISREVTAETIGDDSMRQDIDQNASVYRSISIDSTGQTCTTVPAEHWGKRGPWKTRDFANFRRNGMAAGLDSLQPVWEQREYTEDEAIGINGGPGMIDAWQAIKQHIVPPWFIDRVFRVGVGNPITLDICGDKVTHSDAMCLLNAWRLYCWIEEPPELIAEIGGGFGCLAAQMLRMWPNAMYRGIDLPQSIELQDYYLKESDNLRYRCRLGSKIPHSHDPRPNLIINIRSMMEMSIEQVCAYFEWIQAQPAGSIRLMITGSGYWIPPLPARITYASCYCGAHESIQQTLISGGIDHDEQAIRENL